MRFPGGQLFVVGMPDIAWFITACCGVFVRMFHIYSYFDPHLLCAVTPWAHLSKGVAKLLYIAQRFFFRLVPPLFMPALEELGDATSTRPEAMLSWNVQLVSVFEAGRSTA